MKKFILVLILLLTFTLTGHCWDLLDEDCANISDWSDGDWGGAVSEVDPAGQFRLDTNAGAPGSIGAERYRTIASPPDKFTIECKVYCDSIGTIANADYAQVAYGTATWRFIARFTSEGLFIYKTGAANTEIGTDIVKFGGSAAWQTWRFEVDKSGGEDAATVEVFLDNISQGTVDCDYEVASTDGQVTLDQLGYSTDDMVSHYDYVKIRTGIIIDNAIFFGTNF